MREKWIEPVLYENEECRDIKYKAMLVRKKQDELMKKLKKVDLPASKKIALASAMAYYPGTGGKPLKFGQRSPLKFTSPPSSPTTTMTPTPMELESDTDSIYLFKDLPVKPTGKSRSSTSMEIENDSDPSPPRFAQSRHEHADRRLATPKGQRTQKQSSPVEQLSPALNKTCLERRSISHDVTEALQEKTKPKSPIISKPKGRKLRRCLNSKKPKETKFLKIGSERLRFSRKTAKKSVNDENADDSNRLPDDKDKSPNASTRNFDSGLLRTSENICLLVPDGFSSEKVELVKEFSRRFNARCTNSQPSFDFEITHVLAEPSSHAPDLVDQMRFEYLQAVGFRRYLVSTRWLEDSLEEGRVLEAENYEMHLTAEAPVPAAKMARDSDELLFEGMALLCAKPFKCFTQQQLEELLKYNGAIIARNPKELAKIEASQGKYCIIGKKKFWNKTENKQALERKLGTISVVHYSWISDCFAFYRAKSPLPHLF